MPVTRRGTVEGFERAPGIIIRVLTDGERVMILEVELEAGAVLPTHTHPHEQTGRLLSGRMRFQIGGEVFELDPGDAWMIPSEVPHEAQAIEKSVVIEVFSPPREDYR